MKYVLIASAIILVVYPGSVLAQDGDFVVAVGENNTILLLNDGSWTPVWQGINIDLAAVWESPGGVVYAVGDGGTILRLEAGDWEQMASGTMGNLLDVWGFDEDDIYAVGTLGTILHYDGIAWSPMDSGTGTGLASIWGFSSSNLYAGGYGHTILHYDGISWSEEYSDGTANTIPAIWGSAPDDVYASGTSYNLFHFDGMSWSATTMSVYSMIGMWGTAADDIYGAGGGIQHYNGHKWKTVESCNGGSGTYNDMWGASGSDIYAVGYGGLICHYDGAVWSTVASPFAGIINGIFGRSANDIWIAGDDGTVLHYDGTGWDVVLGMLPGCSFRRIWGTSGENVYVTGCCNDLMHFDGTGWQKMTIPGTVPGNCFYAIDGTGPDDIYIVGCETIGLPPVDAIAYHFDGTDWNEIATSACDMYDVWCAPSGTVYSLGSCWDPVDKMPFYNIYGYNGGVWNQERSTWEEFLDEDYHRVDGCSNSIPIVTGLSDIPFAGFGGIIHIKPESGWSYLVRSDPCDPEDPLSPDECPIWETEWFGIWCISETEYWFAGENGMVLHWTDGGYTETDTGAGVTLLAIWGRSNSDIYAVGQGGTIVHYDGSSWTAMESHTTNELRDIWGTSQQITALLHSFYIEKDAGRVAIHWSLSETDHITLFRVTRRSQAAPYRQVIDDTPALQRTSYIFTYEDRTVAPGEVYTYMVEYENEETWRTLFETGPVSVPEASFSLMLNYPNPFNPLTTIVYSAAAHGPVSLRIYDVSGRLVRTLLDEDGEPGTHAVQWDGLDDQGRQVASGTYFCRLTAWNEAAAHKIMLIR